jgi:hypothetical protein
LRYKVPKLIIGGSIEAMLYAWRTQSKILVKEKKYVYRFDEKFFPTVFPDFNCEDAKHLSSNLSFALSFTGLMPYADNIASIREEDGFVKVITKNNKKIEIEFDELVYFDKDLNTYGVYDFFDTRQMGSHNTLEIKDDSDEFIKKINFYESPRTTNSVTKDFIGSSRMTHKQLLDPDYGPGIAKLKAMRMLKSEGLRGSLSQVYKGKEYYKSPKIEFFKRVIAQEYEPLYNFREVYNMEQIQETQWKTFEMLRKREET